MLQTPENQIFDTEMYHDAIIFSAIGFYILATVFLFVSNTQQSNSWRTVSIISCFVGLVCHALAQTMHWYSEASPDISLLSLLSLCSLVVVLMLCSTVFSRNSLYDASLVALPLALIMLALEEIIPSQNLLLHRVNTGTTLHILSSVTAFGLLSFAGVYALLAAIIDFFLRRHHLNPFVRLLPPLETLERLLFRLLSLGFFLLTISLLTGLAFVSDLFAQHLAHKTILSIMAWLVFGLLLWGRWRYGWRGRYAVRMTLAGIVLLLLAYFGSKLVLENILGRSWHA
ncbi:MAG TPA: cytochrome c biogenesis protein CcsA [Xanthomonadales bacterium]|nr:cytochrome c biogenesis protein CcsA [Xanthomonadales bacterium]